ncbi:MAG: hypothetical protein AB8D78_02560 [Akkermansiaceae bacterium]
MTELPHVFLSVNASIDGSEITGLASEGLPPKWFTKNPETTFEQDLPEMLRVIEQAVAFGREVESDSFFGWWLEVHGRQDAWARKNGVPPLLAHLGTSLVERAMIDAVCRAKGIGFSEAVKSDAFGIDLGAVHAELEGSLPSDWLGDPETSVIARHTVGLGDPLTTDEIPDEDRADDSLPQALADAIDAYGLTHFKVKVCGRLEVDVPRLKRLASLFAEKVPGYRFTLDGNEQYRTVAQFREHWEAYVSEPELEEFLSPEHLIFVEQPMHRDDALLDEVKEGFATWPKAPALIIDESDAELGSLRRALELGYRGTSHKNCKGVFKGLANRCLIEWYRRECPSKQWLMSGEDLANVGPIALLNDLEVMAALRIDDIERNGHHYFKGLSMFPLSLQEKITATYPELYAMTEEGYPSLRIEDGRLDVSTLARPGFGCAVHFSADELGVAGLPSVS